MSRRLVAAALGTAVAVGLFAWAEAWQRSHELGSMRVWFDPPGLKYVLAEGAEDERRGWREGERPLPKRGGRLVCLGDSVTYGVSVAPWETWCAQAGRALRVEALNFGMNGWDAEQVATLLETRIAAWEPDIVAWGAYVNDLFPTYLLYGLTTGDPVFVGSDVPKQARFLPEPLALLLVRNSALFRRLQGAVYARSERSAGPGRAREGWYEAQVSRIVAWSRAEGVPVLALAIPPHAMANMQTCPQQFPVPALCDASAQQWASMIAAIDAAGLPRVDGLTAFQASGQPHFHPRGRLDPDHPNAAGHALLAQAAVPALRAALALPETPTPVPPEGLEATDGVRGSPAPKHPGGGRRKRGEGP